MDPTRWVLLNCSLYRKGNGGTEGQAQTHGHTAVMRQQVLKHELIPLIHPLQEGQGGRHASPQSGCVPDLLGPDAQLLSNFGKASRDRSKEVSTEEANS